MDQKLPEKEPDWQWQKKFVSQWIFYFIAKINYFRPFLQPNFLKASNFVIQGWGNLKTLGCAHPFSPIMKKIFQKPQRRDSNPRPHLAANNASCALPTEPLRLCLREGDICWYQWQKCFCRFLRGLTSFILRFFSEDNAKSCSNIFNLSNLLNVSLLW